MVGLSIAMLNYQRVIFHLVPLKHGLNFSRLPLLRSPCNASSRGTAPVSSRWCSRRTRREAQGNRMIGTTWFRVFVERFNVYQCVNSPVQTSTNTVCFLGLNSESHAKRASQFSWFYSESRRVAEAICHVQLQGLPNSALEHQGLGL